MLTGLFIIVGAGFLAILSHRNARLTRKILKNIPLNEWLQLTVFPLFIYVGFIMIVKNIVTRLNVQIFFMDDWDIVAVMMISFACAFAAIALHFVAKVLWMYLKSNPKSEAYKINEMFHGKFSHYIAFLNSIFIVFMFGLLELNHPISDVLITSYLQLTGVTAIAAGFFMGKTIFYTNEWYGGYNKPLFFVILFLVILSLSVFRFLSLSYSYYPVNLIVHLLFLSTLFSMTLRQILIFSKLPGKGKLRFLSRVLSI